MRTPRLPAVAIAITPDGKTAYINSLATGKAGAPIKVPPTPWTLVTVADPAHP